jgi:hypothetical protein
MTTALDIITKALQKNGVLVKSETPASDEADDALDTLNAMISAWSNDSMFIYARTEENFPLVAGTATYTIGTSQTFNTARPMELISSYVRQGVTDYNLTKIPDETYYGIIDKSTRSIPRFINFTNGFPTATIKLWPVPDTTYTIYLLTEKELSSFTLNQTVSLPPGWEQALIYNLAVLLAPEYGQPVDQSVTEIAERSMGAIKRTIMKNRSMDANPISIRKSNIYNGGFV